MVLRVLRLNMRLSIGRKITLLISSVLLIFIISAFIIQSANTRTTHLFTLFYNNEFLVSMQLEKIQQAQVDIILNIRGLQIAHLLNLDQQIEGYLNTIQHNYELSFELLDKLKTSYSKEQSPLLEYETKISQFHINAMAFIKAMNEAPDHKAPFAVFRQFMTSYAELETLSNAFKEAAHNSAEDTQALVSSAINNANIIFYVSIILAVLAASALSLYFSSGIRKSLKNVRNVAQHIAVGDLTMMTHVDSHDEIGDLGTALNNSINHLRKTIEGISQSANTVNDNSQIIVQLNNQVSKVTDEVTNNTNQVVTAIEEMSASSRNIAQNTTDTATASHAMQDLVHQGLAQSETTINAIGDMISGLNDTSDVVKKLQEEITNIESILDVIRSISEQTNLLALNAAIEAARAGEQGRGFAVVADEVRGLAQRSQNSVNEIESMLGQLSAAGSDAVNRMASSTNKAEGASNLVNENNEITRQMLDRIENVNEQAQQIATAADEQSLVSEEISKNMHTVQSLTNQSTEIANKTNNHSLEMNEVSKTVLDQIKYFKTQSS